jgi:cobalt-precorrin-5B (C1)-methyltransferase
VNKDKLDQSLQRFDLGVLTDAGLRRGYTTGSCATAAVKAALLALLCNEYPEEVNVSLPDGLHFLSIGSSAKPAMRLMRR